MTVIRPEEERFAEFLRATVPQLEVPPVPREEMWTWLVAQHHGHALLHVAAVPEALEVGAEGAEIVVPVAVPASTQHSARGPRAIRLRGWSMPVAWAVPMVAAVLVVGIIVGVQLGGRNAAPASPDAGMLAAAPRLPKEFPTQVAAQHHFREVEQLLANFAEVKATKTNSRKEEAQLVARARDLLSTTQLLLDSPIGMDPTRRHLLTDVELVLMQITQLAPAAPADDRGLVEESIQKSQVVERLQNATPSAKAQTKAPSGP